MRLFITPKFLLAVPILFSLLACNVFAQEEIPGEEIVFKSGELVLNGQLVLPDSAENVPVILFLGGLYDWGEIHPQRNAFIRENLIKVLPEAGIGVMYYSPRGVGASTGRWGRATMNDFAEDAKAALSYLEQRREIDPGRIGIVGLGESGWVAQIVASTSPDQVNSVAALATAPFDANKQLVNEYHSQYICNGETEEVAMEKAQQKALSHQNWVSVLPITRSWRHMNNKRDFDPTSYIRDIKIPALFVFGENDGQVYSDWAMEELAVIFPDSIPDNFTVQTVPGANHFFHVVDPCYEYPRDTENLRLNFSFRFKEVFQNWIFQNL